MDKPLYQNDYVLVGLLLGSVNWILCEILRKSSCRYDSVGHFVFGGMKLCGQDLTIDVHLHDRVTDETTPLVTGGTQTEHVACHINI